jgi:hypothetical protein
MRSARYKNAEVPDFFFFSLASGAGRYLQQVVSTAGKVQDLPIQLLSFGVKFCPSRSVDPLNWYNW